MAGQWEVVGKKKGRNDPAKSSAKQQKKKHMENMPKLEETGPIQESQTMFEAFIEKERKKASQSDGRVNGTAAPAKGKEGTSQSKKKSQDKKKSQPPPSKAVSLEEAIKALNVEDMKNHCATVEARFPESPMVWLQDLASFMNLKLDVEVADPVFSTKPTGYPLCLLSADARAVLLDVFDRCSKQTLEVFFEFCLLSLIHETVKGLNTVGYRICLQCLAQEKPDVIIAALPKAIDVRNSYQNRQNVCLSILWALGQAGNKSLETGLKAWVELMFPILGTRAYSRFIVEYLEKLLSSHKPARSEKCVLGVKEFFHILDFVHSSTGLPANLQKQLLNLYPRLKAMSYGPEPCNILRNFFPSYLRRLEPTCSDSMRKEVLSSLVECLTVDVLSYSVWRQLYTKHLVQSSILISHLNDEWDQLPPTFPRKLLCETLSAFQVTNEELKGQGRASHDVESCMATCSALMNKMTAQRFPWVKLLFFVLISVSALLAYDVQQHGSFRKSKTGELMRDAGLLAICEQAWGKITVYSGKAYKWLEVNVPIYSAWICETFGPYLQVFWEKLFASMVYVWEGTQGVRSWANANIPPILQLLNDSVPGYIRTLSRSTEGIIFQFVSVVQSVAKFFEYYSSATLTWLHKHVFTGSLSAENLQKYAGDAVEALQQYTMTTYNWISKHLTAVTGK